MKCLHYLGNRFPCGQCMACRLNKQREKALRLSHELQYHKDSVFITLTYNPEHLPSGKTLVKKDLQDFMKRLRKEVEPDRIRFFACGEYGSDDHTQHPHYHLIVFGLAYNDKRVFTQVQFLPSSDVYRCNCKAWDKGFVTVGKVNQARINYVAKYVVKKVTGKLSKQMYGDRLPEFSLCSRNPGIGYQYAEEHLNRIKEDGFCSVRGNKVPIPRYYIDKFYSHSDKFDRERARNKSMEEAFRKQIDEFNSQRQNNGFREYQHWLEAKLETAKGILARRIQMKGKSKCQVS